LADTGPQEIYNTYLRYGWGSDNFDKQACGVTLTKMQQDHSRESRRLYALNDPDSVLFD